MAHHELHRPNNTPLSTADTNPDQDDATPMLAAYIRRIVDTAPRPNPAQLTRLAGLLSNADYEPEVHN